MASAYYKHVHNSNYDEFELIKHNIKGLYQLLKSEESKNQRRHIIKLLKLLNKEYWTLKYRVHDWRYRT